MCVSVLVYRRWPKLRLHVLAHVWKLFSRINTPCICSSAILRQYILSTIANTNREFWNSKILASRIQCPFGDLSLECFCFWPPNSGWRGGHNWVCSFEATGGQVRHSLQVGPWSSLRQGQLGFLLGLLGKGIPCPLSFLSSSEKPLIEFSIWWF